ncbi:MAG: hypothetical protein FJ217_13115 [Ignavibacteria bacterium]|nr:hypothetical protein [Ignavibacteria bacterium]
MIEQKYADLIQKEIDGVITDAEGRSLKDYLARNKEARRLREELQKTVERLKSVPQLDPPPYLKKHILNSLGVGQPVTTPGPRLLDRLAKAFSHRLAPRYAIVFCSGFCLGIILLFLVLQSYEPVSDMSQFTGALMTVGDTRSWKVIDSLSIETEDARGVVRSLDAAGHLFVEVDLRSAGKAEVELTGGPDYAFGSYTKLVGDALFIEVNPACVKISHVDKAHYLVWFAGGLQKGRELDFKLRVGATTITESVQTGDM